MMIKSSVRLACFKRLKMAVQNIGRRFPISPTNPNGFGKAGTNVTARIVVSIPGYTSMDHTRVPPRYAGTGTATGQTIGRY